MAGEEVLKLQRHLSLLREEYVKLQNRLAESEKRCSVALAQLGGSQAEDSFVARLLKTVASLFDKELYSDLTVMLEGKAIRAHRFVLSARSNDWGVPNLGDIDRLDLTDINQDIGLCLLKWVYTDQINLGMPDSDILQLVKLAKRFKLDSLMDKCEKALISSVNVSNCVRFYQTADEIGAETLKCHSSELISSHWDEFTSEDFAHMAAPLLFKMFKGKTEYPLHTAIRTQREDVVFLYLIEFDSQLPSKLNEVDNLSDLPLDLALKSRQESVAQTLVMHKAGLNVTDHIGRTLLHRAVDRGDEFSATFLIENGAAVDIATPLERETVLHSLAGFKGCDGSSPEICASMGRIAKRLLTHGANPNLQDSNGDTPLHRAISSKNEPVFKVLLEQPSLNLELSNADNHTSLWLALLSGDLGDKSYASQLVKKGSSVDALNPTNGECLLHLAAKQDKEDAGIFLANHGAKVNLANSKGECPLHIACSHGLSSLVTVLLKKGANPNLQTTTPDFTSSFTYNDVKGSEDVVSYLQTPLHLAIAAGKEATVQAIIDHKNTARIQAETVLIVPNFNLKNSADETPLALALKCSFHNVAQQLLAGGANINVTDSQGSTMLHRAIMDQDSQGALFLIENGSDITVRTRDDESPLQLAVKRHLPVVVEALCVNGADLNISDVDNNTPLWVALESGQEDVASILVKYGCDTDCWGVGPGGCQQTLLHKAIDENNESVACFLIRSGCDVDTSRKPGLDGQCEEEGRDGQSPLHLCGAWGLEKVVQCLIEHNANVNIQDAEGKAPIHVAISNQHPTIISLLLSHPGLDLTIRDKSGLTPFAAAMTTRNNKAAEAILARTPNAAEQYDNKGRNFLHIAIQKSDIESVLFLLSINVNIHSRLKDSSQLSPLHLAVESNTEILVRNLLLAGADINDKTPQKQTALHLAAIKDHSTICSVLLENGIEFDAVDTNLNNALHIACQKGNLASCRVLLTESGINAEAINLRGQNPVHVLCQYGKENAATIFDLFIECMPKYPVDKADAEGNSPLLLAYMNGNGNLCRSIVRTGVCVGSWNRNNINIFNFQVATKQLLFRLLDFLSQEPTWCETGDQCMQCENKFGITTRKHHCRHCGRLLCSKCSERDVPILKYGLNKPVRVCEMCFDVLTLGTSS